MITITLRKPNKLNTTVLSPLSAFVSFDYDAGIVQILQSMSSRVYIPETREWEVPMSQVATLCNKLARYDVEITGELLETGKGNTLTLPASFQFKTTPYNHQIEGVEYGLNHNTFLLGDEQGLGKTKQTIDLAVLKKGTEKIKHCLIICGVNGVKYNWQNEVAIHSNETSWVLGTRYTKRDRKAYEGSSEDKLYDLNHLPSDFFIITNIETLRGLSKNIGTKKRKKMVYPIADKITELCKKGEIGMIAFDECHKAKNPESNQGEALLKISAKNMVALSGTPLMNNPLDLFVPLKWLGYEDHNYYQFKQHYCVFGGFGGTEIVGYKNLGDIRQLLETMMVRRLKSEVLDLPEKTHITEYVEMGAQQASIYKEVHSDIKNNIDKIRIAADPLAQLIRLRQATGYPGILSSSITDSAKLDRLEELVEEVVQAGDKCLIFSNWEQMTGVVWNKMKKYNPAYIVGDVDPISRVKEEKRFQTDDNCKVIIGTIGAMGTGLTLTAGTTVIFMDEPWNRALKDQAEDRAHRIGTKGTVTIITLITKGTIDERIQEIVYKKGRMSDMLVDGKVVDTKRAAMLDYLIS